MFYKRIPNFLFYTKTKLIFGEGAISNLKIELENINKCMLITDKGLLTTDIIDRVKEYIGNKLVGVYDEVIPDTSFEIIDEGAKLTRENNCECLISIGGGSVIDTAKGIAIVATLGGNIKDYIGVPTINNKLITHIAIPTTAGTGSEVTRYAVIKDKEKNIKVSIAHNAIMPDVAILDPTLTINLPKNLTTSCGMDALSHSIEALHSITHNPLSDALALHSIYLINNYLPIAADEPTNLMARAFMLIAASLSGIAFNYAFVGIVHALAHTVGAKFNIPHGVANSILLPYGMEYNLDKAAKVYAQLSSIFGIDNRLDNNLKNAQKVIDKIKEFTKSLALPQKLSEVGAKKDRLEEVAKATLQEPCILTNIKRVTHYTDILKILERAF